MKSSVLVACGVATVALFETAQALYAPVRVATSADWDQAAREVRASLGPRDLVVFAPAWADQVGRAHLGDKVSVEMAGRADADRYARIWELSIRGAHAPEVAGLRPTRESRHGRVAVALYEKPAVTVLYDFTSAAEAARVTQVTFAGGSETPCLKDGGGFRCASSRVEPRTLEVDYVPRRGILTPADAGRVTHVEFTDVKLGKTLVGYNGLHDYFSRKNADGVVDFALFIDGEERFAHSYRQAEGWRRFTVDTSHEAGSSHTVRFEVSSRQAAWRTFGFHAEARE